MCVCVCVRACVRACVGQPLVCVWFQRCEHAYARACVVCVYTCVVICVSCSPRPLDLASALVSWEPVRHRIGQNLSGRKGMSGWGQTRAIWMMSGPLHVIENSAPPPCRAQFSIAPWQYDDEVVRISRRMTQLHESHGDLFIQLARESTRTGAPIIRPLW